jgi:hypothetical protein
MANTSFSSDAPPYRFVNGNGDLQHQTQINDLSMQGYEVVSMAFDALRATTAASSC